MMKYWVEWVRVQGPKGDKFAITHAVPDTGWGARALCGVKTTDGGFATVDEAGGVGCKRCRAALEKLGRLPAV